MAAIKPSETVLRGQWVFQDGHPVADPITQRIFELIQSQLSKITHEANGWDTLYRDRTDGRYWELTYPQSELHGGGPPELRWLSLEEAKRKYGIDDRE